MVPAPVDSFLSNWMGTLLGAGSFGDLSILDLSLPGSHDTLSYDLSTETSDGGIDDSLVLAEILHTFSSIIPNSIEDYIRQQAQTQALSITAQLDNGVRFFDIRLMYQYSDSISKDWFSLHFMKSNFPSTKYFREIKTWLDDHPKELVVLWLSKHGNECATGEDQFPKTPVAVKQAFWGEIVDIFSSLLVDVSSMPIHTTKLSTLVASNRRVVIYASDYRGTIH